MGYNLQQKRYLLPLAKKPPGLVSMAQWRPFKDGSTLDVIINNFNRRSVSYCENLAWLKEHVELYASVIMLKERDLSTIDQLRIEDFTNLHILLVDVDT